MLDIIRKKASSWVTRAIFAGVVLVFIFFFGYNQIDTPNQGPQAVLVRVNGADIRQNEFNLAFKSTQESYKQVFKGDIPEGMAKMIVQSALQQLISQRLMIDAAHHMGLRVSDEELLKAIESNNKLFVHDGVFDRVAYRQKLQDYERENGLNYEELLRNELLARKLNDLLQASVKVSPEEAKLAYWQEKSKFTFEVSQTATGQATPTKRTVGPVTVADRLQVLGADATGADFARVFTLTTSRPQLDAPLVIRDIQYMVKLTKRDRPSEADWKKDEVTFTKDLLIRKQAGISQEWLESLAKKADIEQLQTPNEG